MDCTKNLSVKLPQSLHEQITANKGASGLTLNEYVTQIITKFYEQKGGNSMEKTKTIAIQVSEELKEKITAHLTKTGLSLKQFLTELIENAINETEELQ